MYFLLFGTAIVYDIIIVLWFEAMAAKRIILAAFFAPMMVLIANFEAKSFVFDNYALIPLCLGTFLGTIIGAKLGTRISRWLTS